MTTDEQVCKKHVIHTKTQQDDGRSDVRLPTMMNAKQLGTSRLAAERKLHILECRLEQELKDQYQYFMRKAKGQDHSDPVNSQEATNHSSSLQGNKFPHNAQITTEFNRR